MNQDTEKADKLSSWEGHFKPLTLPCYYFKQTKMSAILPSKFVSLKYRKEQTLLKGQCPHFLEKYPKSNDSVILLLPLGHMRRCLGLIPDSFRDDSRWHALTPIISLHSRYSVTERSKNNVMTFGPSQNSYLSPPFPQYLASLLTIQSFPSFH